VTAPRDDASQAIPHDGGIFGDHDAQAGHQTCSGS
jgi:hypothetical protein